MNAGGLRHIAKRRTRLKLDAMAFEGVDRIAKNYSVLTDLPKLAGRDAACADDQAPAALHLNPRFSTMMASSSASVRPSRLRS